MSETIRISEIRNAGFGDFRAVSVIVESGREYGCDAHLGRGSHDEAPHDVLSPRLIDWEDGNGLLTNDVAGRREIWDAVHDAETSQLA